MPFGLCNAPATFQAMFNGVFYDYIDRFVAVYIDDILIFSETLEEHDKHLKLVLQRLQDNKLHARPTKCEFYKQDLEYLGYRIADNRVMVLPGRLSTIADFEHPTSWTELRSFIGLANTIHRFIPNQASIIAPLTDLLRGCGTKQKPSPFKWEGEQRDIFEKARSALSNPTTLAIFDPKRPVHLYTDWSERAIGSYICQPDENGMEAPIAYASRQCNQSESSYHPYQGEILALCEGLKQHRQYLIGYDAYVFTDHDSLHRIME
jgi:hypothetical protein